MADGAFNKGEMGILLGQPFMEVVRIVALETELVLPFVDGIRFQMGDIMVTVAGVAGYGNTLAPRLLVHTVEVCFTLRLMAVVAIHHGQGSRMGYVVIPVQFLNVRMAVDTGDPVDIMHGIFELVVIYIQVLFHAFRFRALKGFIPVALHAFIILNGERCVCYKAGA